MPVRTTFAPAALAVLAAMAATLAPGTAPAAGAAAAAGAPAAASAAAAPNRIATTSAPPAAAAGTPAATAASAAAGSPAAAAPAAASDPWSWLTRVRRSLVEAGPTTATFTQTYVPAGFTSGEKETGSLSLHLPDCLHWDYKDPYPKGFLLCGEMVHAWNPEDHTGRRYRIDRKNEPGLDLLLLGVDDLKARYSAVTRSSPNGQVEIALTPKGKAGELSDAALAIDPATLRVVQVAYHDREGNLTRFQLGDYRPLSLPGQFAPPSGIHWEEQP
ncbi:MAG TPA: outer membrane lipoprotein carrier protein LolA [Thermoanaerobaculia bacterium]|nr:outer membrane lipoprotein carrier protein LolA [Thermoanaerobaculia bacterium]